MHLILVCTSTRELSCVKILKIVFCIATFNQVVSVLQHSISNLYSLQTFCLYVGSKEGANRRREETTMERYWRRNNRQCNLNCILISVIDPAIRVCDKSMCLYVFCSRFEFHIVVAQKWVRRLIDNRNFRLHNELNKEKKNQPTNLRITKENLYFISFRLKSHNIILGRISFPLLLYTISLAVLSLKCSISNKKMLSNC